MEQQPNSQSPEHGDVYPSPEQSSTEPQTHPMQPQSQETPPKSNTGKIIAIVIVVVILIAIIIGAFFFFTVKKSTDVAINNANNRVGNAKVKANVMNLKMSIESYYVQHNTFVGWTPDSQIISSAKSGGAPITIQSVTAKTYVIYAPYTSGGKIFCTDAQNQENEITTIKPTAQTCK